MYVWKIYQMYSNGITVELQFKNVKSEGKEREIIF